MTDNRSTESDQRDSLADDADDSALWAEFERDESAEAAPEETPPVEGREDEDAAGTDDAPLQAADDRDEEREADPPKGDDPWERAAPEHRAAYEAAQKRLAELEQYRRSNEGRVAAFQRQLQELRGGSQPAQAAAPAVERSKAAVPDAPKGAADMTPEEWDSFAEEYPEVAAPISKRMGSLEAQLSRQNEVIEALAAERRVAASTEQAQLLADEHPDWQTFAATAEFLAWLGNQPEHIRWAAEQNAKEIVDANVAADVLGRFKAFRSGQQGDQARQNAAGNTAGTGNSRLTGKRQRQLESAAATRSRGPGVASGMPPEDGDPEMLWRQFEEAERRQAGRV